MNCARNCENLLNFVKVIPKTLLVPFFSGHGVDVPNKCEFSTQYFESAQENLEAKYDHVLFKNFEIFVFTRCKGVAYTQHILHDAWQLTMIIADRLFSSFLNGGVRRPSLRPSVNICVNDHLRKSLLLPGKWLNRDQTHSFTNLPFPFSSPFSSTPQSLNGCEFAL